MNDIEVVHVLVLTIEWPYYVHGTNTVTVILVFTAVITENLTLNHGLFNAEVTTTNCIT